MDADDADGLDLLSRALNASSRVSDDTLHFNVYPDPSLLADGEHEALQELHDVIAAFLASRCEGYLWHSDPPVLAIRSQVGKRSEQCVCGSLRFCESVPDEWLLAKQLFDLSAEMPNITITMRDDDGEFLLIEAALALPRWLTPRTSCNRVFVRKGHLCVVPRSPPHWFKPAAAAGTRAEKEKSQWRPSLRESLTLLRQSDDTGAAQVCLAPVAVRDAVSARLHDSTGAEAEASNCHRVRCMLPSSVAYVLSQEPRLIAAAVDAFVRRDTPDAASEVTSAGHSIGRGTAHIVRGRGSHGGPKSDSIHAGDADGCVPQPQQLSRDQNNTNNAMRSVAQVVRLTRLMYAQLRHVTYYPPPKFVALLQPQSMAGDSGLDKAITLGAQLSVGFERLLLRTMVHDRQRKAARNGGAVGATATYQPARMSANAQGNTNRTSAPAPRNAQPTIADAGRCIQQMLEQWTGDNASASLNDCSDPAHELQFHELPLDDSDDWMSLTADDMAQMLNNNSAVGTSGAGRARTSEAHTANDSDSAALSDMVESMHHFVSRASGVEGVEPQNRESGIHAQKRDDRQQARVQAHDPVMFDVERFERLIRHEMGATIHNAGADNNDDSDYSSDGVDDDFESDNDNTDGDGDSDDGSDSDSDNYYASHKDTGCSKVGDGDSDDGSDRYICSVSHKTTGCSKGAERENAEAELSRPSLSSLNSGTRQAVITENAMRSWQQQAMQGVACAQLELACKNTTDAGGRSDADSDDEDVTHGSAGGSAEVIDVMHAMDDELLGSTMQQSFIRGEQPLESTPVAAPVPATPETASATATGEGTAAAAPTLSESQLEPVNLDLNLVTHLLESFASQQGLAGPVSTMMHEMGLALPKQTADPSAPRTPL